MPRKNKSKSKELTQEMKNDNLMVEFLNASDEIKSEWPKQSKEHYLVKSPYHYMLNKLI